jgi:hypothetical protein
MVPIHEVEITLGEFPSETDDSDLLQETVAAYLAGMVTQLEGPYRETLTLTELQGMKYADGRAHARHLARRRQVACSSRAPDAAQGPYPLL